MLAKLAILTSTLMLALTYSNNSASTCKDLERSWSLGADSVSASAFQDGCILTCEEWPPTSQERSSRVLCCKTYFVSDRFNTCQKIDSRSSRRRMNSRSRGSFFFGRVNMTAKKKKIVCLDSLARLLSRTPFFLTNAQAIATAREEFIKRMGN